MCASTTLCVFFLLFSNSNHFVYFSGQDVSEPCIICYIHLWNGEIKQNEQQEDRGTRFGPKG